MPESELSGQDHGLGAEVVDRSTAIGETFVDPERRRKLEVAQSRGVIYWVFAGIALVLLSEQASFDFLLYNPILGDLAAKYHTSNVVWVMTGLNLAAAVALPLFSRLADIYGKKRSIGIAGSVTMLGCLIGAVAPTFTVLIVGRVLMGAGVAFGVLAVVAIREVFPVRARAIAIAVTVNGAGLIIVGGPLLAGWLADQWGVSAPFWFQLILCALSVVMVMVLVPESPVRVRSRVDYLGAVLLGAGLFCLLIGLGQVTSLGWGSFTLGFTAAGAVLFALWLLQLRRSTQPLINPKLLKNRAILTTTVSAAFLNGTVVTLNVVIVLMWSTPRAVARYGHDLTPFDIAIWTIPFAVLTVAGGVLVGLTVRSVGYRTYMILSGVFMVASAVLLAVNLESSAAVLIASYALGGLGSMFMAASSSLVLLASPPDQRGIVSGVSKSMATIAASVVQVLVFSVLAASVLTVVGGVAVFAEGGYRVGLLTAAAVAAAGLIAAVLIPHGRPQPRHRMVDDVTSTVAAAPLATERPAARKF